MSRVRSVCSAVSFITISSFHLVPLVLYFQSLMHCGFGVLVDENFNCLANYLGFVEKACFIFGVLFISLWTTDDDALKRFALHARSACHLTVAKGDNTFFKKWVKLFLFPTNQTLPWVCLR